MQCHFWRRVGSEKTEWRSRGSEAKARVGSSTVREAREEDVRAPERLLARREAGAETRARGRWCTCAEGRGRAVRLAIHRRACPAGGDEVVRMKKRRAVAPR